MNHQRNGEKQTHNRATKEESTPKYKSHLSIPLPLFYFGSTNCFVLFLHFTPIM